MKIRLNSIVAAVMVMLTAACSLIPQPAHNVTIAHPEYDASISARVRFLVAGNGTFRSGEACYKAPYQPDEKRVELDNGFLASLKYSSDSVTISMPPSPRPYMRVDGLYMKNYIKEYVVPAATPLTLKMLVELYNGYCTPPAVTFVPAPGKDYDVFVEAKGGQCWVSARRIDAQGIDEPVSLKAAPACPEQAATTSH